MTTWHMCANIRGMLNNFRRKGSLDGILTDRETGRPLGDQEARKYLHDCLAKGWRVIPMGECDDFDYQTGCKGHEKEDTRMKQDKPTQSPRCGITGGKCTGCSGSEPCEDRIEGEDENG